MAPDERNLPLFPLNTVLFPNALLPLQIFEERYKEMLRDCLNADSRFGIVLIKSGQEVGESSVPHNVGTVGQIVQVSEARGGSRFFVSLQGERRFSIKSITQHRPYMAADVELLDEETQPDLMGSEMERVKGALTQYRSLISGLEGGWVGEARITADPVTLSYHIASVLQINMAERQALLEEPSASARLQAELKYLKRDVDVLKRQVSRRLLRKFSNQ
ncbi:MAG: LON peptidase substrate-binding domain-containing protein [Chloroflexi bacterium]|nr:LON peptidase substrate-binding domain-containing protein [Chloroflexota bacterium]